jgi:hypothetical protein
MSYISAIRPQAIEDTKENRSWYGQCASAPRIYAYVGNDPLNLTDPLGLCDNPQGCGGSSSNQLIASTTGAGSGLPTQTTPTTTNSTTATPELPQYVSNNLALQPFGAPPSGYASGIAGSSLTTLPAADGGIQLAAVTLFCQNVVCGAPTAGTTYPLCQNCATKLLKGNGGMPMRLERGILLQPGTNLFPDDE